MSTDLTIVEGTGLDAFAPFHEQIATWKERAATITITSPDQVAEIRFARESRLGLKRVRCSIENLREELGAPLLERKRAIDAFAKGLMAEIEPIEKRLAEQEKIAERMIEEARAQLRAERAAALDAIGVHVMARPAALDTMSAEEWAIVFADFRTAAEAKKEAAQKEELRATRTRKLQPFLASDAATPSNIADLAEDAWRALLFSSRAAHEKREESARKEREAAAAEKQRLEDERVARERERDAEIAKLKAEADAKESELRAVRELAEREKAAAAAEAKRVADEERAAQESAAKALAVENAEKKRLADAREADLQLELAKERQHRADLEAAELRRAAEEQARAARDAPLSGRYVVLLSALRQVGLYAKDARIHKLAREALVAVGETLEP